MRRAPESGRRDFVSGTARQAVVAVVPEELVFFEPLAAEFAKRGELPRERRYADGIIESGWDTAVALVTPVALTLARSLYNQLADDVSDQILKSGGRGLSRVWRRLRHREQAASEPAAAPQSEETVEGTVPLRERLLQQARELGLPEDRVEPLVEALLAAAAREGLPPQSTPQADTTGNA